jgi:hypothetical protein
MRPDGALDRVRVHLDPAVIEERHQAGPMTQRVTHGLREIGGSGHPMDVDLQPIVQSLDNRSTSLLPDFLPAISGLATDLGFDRVEHFPYGRPYPELAK